MWCAATRSSWTLDEVVKVLLYLCEGTYTGASAHSYTAPRPGPARRFILFLRQMTEAPSVADAVSEAARFGFSPITVLNMGPMAPEALNSTPAFSKHYEEALTNGSSLVWYANAGDSA